MKTQIPSKPNRLKSKTKTMETYYKLLLCASSTSQCTIVKEDVIRKDY